MSRNRTVLVGICALAALCLVLLALRAGGGISAGPQVVTFRQEGACSPQFWGVPWSVTIDGQTKVQPAGTKLPLDDNLLQGTANESLATISFLLPSGTYAYEVRPSNMFFSPSSGTVTVGGGDVEVDIALSGTSCTTTVTATP
ncbi:MAG TPA: hypothetical protein VMS77_00350 [Conexivisphaerales archaeon]|nr:hypothetical protein [Conexivisphaerales archaeon]